MIILGIETSCDETGLALVEAEGDILHPKFKTIGSTLYSQVAVHAKYGGVFPMMAKREHMKNLVPLLKQLLEETKCSKLEIKNYELGVEIKEKIKKILDKDQELIEPFEQFISTIEKPKIDAIAVTVGPGLEPCLWTGINFAKALSIAWNIPIIPTNHMAGHIFSVLASEALNAIKFPAMALLISGGHTELVYSKKQGDYEIVGKTRDDAVGEAFDKVARILELPYPGGPEISILAEKAKSFKLKALSSPLPRPMIRSKDLDFSFSGLKTAVLYMVQKMGTLTHEDKCSIALEFENSVIDVLVAKTKNAIEAHTVKSLIIGGGVIANKKIREALNKLAEEFSINFHIPTPKLSTDNAIMIAMAGYYEFKTGKGVHGDALIEAKGNLTLSTTK